MNATPIGPQPERPFRFEPPEATDTVAEIRNYDDDKIRSMYRRGRDLQAENERLGHQANDLGRRLTEKHLCETEVAEAKRILEHAQRTEDERHARWLTEYDAAKRAKTVAWGVGVTEALVIVGLATALGCEQHRHTHARHRDAANA